MGYRLTPKPGFLLHIVITPPVTVDDARAMVAEIHRLTEAEDWERVRVLMDLSAVGKIPGPVGKAFANAAEGVKNPRPNRVAMVGASRAVRVIASFITSLVPKYQNTKFFDKEAEGLAWLMQPVWPEIPKGMWRQNPPA